MNRSKLTAEYASFTRKILLTSQSSTPQLEKTLLYLQQSILCMASETRERILRQKIDRVCSLEEIISLPGLMMNLVIVLNCLGRN